MGFGGCWESFEKSRNSLIENMKHHPEQKEDEIYLGTTSKSTINVSAWKTKRLANFAYKKDYTPILDSEVASWFVKISEVQSEIDRLKDSAIDSRNFLIEIYQEMVNERSSQGLF